MLEAKKNGQVYHKQDTHWNEFGAFVGYKAISQTIAKDSEINYNFEVQFPEEKLSDLDLIQMSGIKDILKDVENYKAKGDLEIEIKNINKKDYIIYSN